jgi:hypothetical protein
MHLSPPTLSFYPPLPGISPSQKASQPTENQAKKPIFRVEPTGTECENFCAQGLKVRHVITLTSLTDLAGPGTSKAVFFRSVRLVQTINHNGLWSSSVTPKIVKK